MRRTTRLISSLTVSAAKSVGHGSRKLHYSSRLLQNGSDESIVTTFTANTINKPVTSPATGGDSTIFDTEKEMFQIRRKMTAAYSLGKYQLALEHALDLEAKAAQIMGKRNAVYASCLNNVALMYKMQGEQEAAMNKYTDALHVYMDVTGKDHVSYAATLSNLGVLYKDMSKGRVVSRNNSDNTGGVDENDVVVVPVKGMEKLQLLERAEEALVEARDTRIRLLGKAHKDSLYSTLHLASLFKLRAGSVGGGGRDGKAVAEAQRLLEEALALAQETYGDADIICGSLHNDLGVLYKSKALHELALEHYTKALEIRSKVLGDTHNDTVVTVYNLAELHSAMGNKELATELQEALVTTLQGRDGASSGAQPQAQAQQHPQAQAYQDGQQQQREDSSTPVLTQERSILRGRLDVNLYKNSSSSGGGNPPPLTATGQEKINIADIIARDLASDSAVHQNNNSSSINSNSATGAATTPTGAAGTGAAVGAGEEVKKTPPQTFASRMNKPATRRKPAAAIP